MTDALELPGRPAPMVRSKAAPQPLTLLGVRLTVKHHPELQQLFVRFRSEGKSVDWLMDILAVRLTPLMPEVPFEQIIDAAQYLADEYDQLGEAPLLVSRETGRAVMLLSEDDFVDPGLLPRESGESAQALKRLNPALEAAIVTSYHEQGRETHVLRVLQERTHATPLQLAVGDRRLRIASRSGRRALAGELRDEDSWTLLRRAGGTAAMLLQHFDLAEDYDGPWDCLEGMASARSVLGTQDMTTLNVAYDRLGVLRATVPQAWLADVARQLSAAGRARNPEARPHSLDALTAEAFGSRELWVVDYDAFRLLHGVRRALPTAGAEGAFGVRGRAGWLVVPHTFSVESVEVSDHWEVTATLPFRLYVDWSATEYLSILGVPRAAEICR